MAVITLIQQFSCHASAGAQAYPACTVSDAYGILVIFTYQ